ncbi:MAG: pro-sigmaK processing inhibitor BofA family protein [Methanosarcina thermophila]|jgi:hypothetical protein|uniref:SigmaK-factor processing regulatory protein BofA n=3 Tax=Methanosarcina thermophila TaxID=2210 RepID=A0A1I6YTZ1_METTE|nr:pro-sigmaK processing inhibitor BofA family protein [Methanosarcina thermophila]ALK05085.1 MAG: SigmaK-factor processing regulatory protein BofA [Methanosarcina sp. 795]AKB13829.1 hypothetical protein MSTHT_2071 [Methanosarcina thermophila TM-1]AKB15531.1 hypothetical protein MSTHC_1213 [Methanosarcina thermophila CHTI-55]NLU58227.1 transcriptional regulator [Methanosarcina thermophila]SFT53893.1 SigmaK-factor processing regulatory protein BofA [Methanosarcina thermophila]
MVVEVIEILVLALAIVVAFLLYKVLKTATSLAINAVLGVLVLLAAKVLLGLNITITLVEVIICAIGGIFGALAIIVLNYLGIAFI